MNADETITYGSAVAAIGHVSAELAARADAWNGNAPEWFPEPPEWLALFDAGLEATKGVARVLDARSCSKNKRWTPIAFIRWRRRPRPQSPEIGQASRHGC